MNRGRPINLPRPVKLTNASRRELLVAAEIVDTYDWHAVRLLHFSTWFTFLRFYGVSYAQVKRMTPSEQALALLLFVEAVNEAKVA